jgi:pyruvate/2-oxoacid:ferredoxin oxidoreductase beta subunit
MPQNVVTIMTRNENHYVAFEIYYKTTRALYCNCCYEWKNASNGGPAFIYAYQDCHQELGLDSVQQPEYTKSD